VKGEETVEVEIPRGVMTGNYLSLRGRGESGRRGGPAGNLIVVVEVAEHDIFERHGNDLLADLPVSPARAALGGSEEVPTLDGRASIEIPSGVQTGKILRIRGKGLPPLNGGNPGDLLFRVIVYVPTKISAREREIYSELAEIEAKKSVKPGRGVFDRIRETLRG
jgi:molecular chaperone DnaJ